MTAFAGRFEDRVAVVTGGAQGIGLAVAQRLVAEGARVVIWDSNAEANESGLVALAAGVMATSATLDIVDEGAASGGCGRGHIRPHRCARSFSRDSRP